MKILEALLFSVLVVTGCDSGNEQAISGGERLCKLHHRPLKHVSGYAPGPDLMVSPGYGVAEFNTQFGDRYPYYQRVALSSSEGDGWTEEMTVEVCEECQKEYSRDFANYLKIDEKERWDQFMNFLAKNRPADRAVIDGSIEGEERQGESILPPP